MGLSRILFDNRLKDATPAASSTAAGNYNVLNLRGARPYTWWKPATVPAYVDVDSARSTIADAIAIIGHDLGSKQAEVALFASEWPFGSNLWTFPEDFTNAAWTKLNATVANTSAVPAPDGTTTADVLTDDATNGYHYVSRNVAQADNSSYMAAVYARAGTGRYLWIEAQDKAGSFAHAATFDLQTGTVTATVGVTATIAPVGGVNAPGIWFECSIVWGSASGGTPSPSVFIGIHNGTGIAAPYAGSGSTLYIWGARMQIAEAPVPYVAASGWMDTGRAVWAARKNLITSPEVIGSGVSGWSEFNDGHVDVQRMWVTPPDMPTVRAHKVFCKTTGAVQRQIIASPALADHTIYCASALLQAAEVPAVALTWASKAGNFPQVLFNLQTGAFVSATSSGGESAVAYGIESRGGGWYRVWGAFDSKSGVATPGANWILRSAGGANYSGAVGDGLLFAAPKIEVGAAPTPYVPLSDPPLFGTFSRSVARYRRLYVAGASAPSLAAVMFGQAMTLPCGLEAPFDPRGRKVDGRKVNNDNGQPLGSFVDYEKWEASIRLRAIPWSWVRSTWEPAWNAALRSEPFVFCWEPDAYAAEARLVTTDGDWDAPHSPGSLCDLTFKLRGVA